MFSVKIASFLTNFISIEEKNPKTTPSMMAPNVSSKNSCPIYKIGGALPFTSSKLIVKRTIHVPSLKRL